MCQFSLLRKKHLGVKIVNQIFGILIVMDNRRVSTDCYWLTSKPCQALANILNIFTCNCHDNIIGLCHLLLFRTFLTYKGKRLIRKQSIFCINLPVMDARHPLCKKIFLLKVSSTRNCCNFTQFLVFHTIRAKLPNQLIQFTHNTPSFLRSSVNFCSSRLFRGTTAGTSISSNTPSFRIFTIFASSVWLIETHIFVP